MDRDQHPPTDATGRPLEGGAGGLRPDLAELRLERMALAQYQHVPPEMMRRMVDNADLIQRSSKSTRAKIAAGKLLLEMRRLNLDVVRTTLQARALDLEERVRKLEEAWHDGDRGSDSQAD